MSVKNIKNEKELNKAVKQSRKPVIVLFTGTYCAACQEFSPIFEKVANRLFRQLDFTKININDISDDPDEYFPSQGIPHIVLWDNSELVSEVNPENLPGAEAFEDELRITFGSKIPPVGGSKAAFVERWETVFFSLNKDLLCAYCRRLQLEETGGKDSLVARLSYRMAHLSQKNYKSAKRDFRKMVEAYKGKDLLQKAARKLDLSLASGPIGDIADAMFDFVFADIDIGEESSGSQAKSLRGRPSISGPKRRKLKNFFNNLTSEQLRFILAQTPLLNGSAKWERINTIVDGLRDGSVEFEQLLDAMLKEDLQELCEARGLPLKGKVVDLKQRLSQWFEEDYPPPVNGRKSHGADSPDYAIPQARSAKSESNDIDENDSENDEEEGSDEETDDYFQASETIHTRDIDPSSRRDAQLFDYQREAVEALSKHFFEKKNDAGILCLPTGGGKTRTSLDWLLKNFIAKNKRVLWITHRVDLLNQVQEELRSLAWLVRDSRESFTVSRFQGGHTDLSGDFVLASAQKIAVSSPSHSELNSNRVPLGVVCYDEAHRAIAKARFLAIEKIRNKKKIPLLGLTATPYRTGETEDHKFKRIFGKTPIYHVTFVNLIEKGILARPKIVHQPLHSTKGFMLSSDEQQYISKMKEFPPKAISRLCRTPKRNEEIVNYWCTNKETLGKTIAFAADIDHADALASQFSKKGVKAAVVHSRKKPEEREAIIRDFHASKTEVLVNVGILTEGANIPDTRTVLMTRPTLSKIAYIQMIGRGARGPKVVKDKHFFTVVDCVDNFSKHSLTLAGPIVAEELGVEVISKPKTERVERARARQKQRICTANAVAWLLQKGFDPDHYNFWGVVRWNDKNGFMKEIAVFSEKVSLFDHALSYVRRAIKSDFWNDAEKRGNDLENEHACRYSDWHSMVEDCKKTGKAPELIRIEGLKITEEDKTLGDTLRNLAEEFTPLPTGKAKLHCQKYWTSHPELHEQFAKWEGLWASVDSLIKPPTSVAPKPPLDWESIEAYAKMAIAVAQADGEVEDAEIETAMNGAQKLWPELESGGKSEELARLMRFAKDATCDGKNAADAVVEKLAVDKREAIFDHLLAVAQADGKLDSKETKVLRNIAMALRLPDEIWKDRIALWEDTEVRETFAPIAGFKTCPQCHTTMPQEANFCGECRAQLSWDKPKPKTGQLFAVRPQ